MTIDTKTNRVKLTTTERTCLERAFTLLAFIDKVNASEVANGVKGVIDKLNAENELQLSD